MYHIVKSKYSKSIANLSKFLLTKYFEDDEDDDDDAEEEEQQTISK